jgi:hypothetical protein
MQMAGVDASASAQHELTTASSKQKDACTLTGQLHMSKPHRITLCFEQTHYDSAGAQYRKELPL